MRTRLRWDPPEGRLIAIWRGIQIKEGWLSAFLLVVVMLSTVWSVEAAKWVIRLPSLGWIALVALGFGMVFAKMHFRGLVLHPIAFVYGLSIALWQTMSIIELPTWEARFVDLVLRLNAWGYAARSGGINNDSLVFVFTLVGLTLIIGYLSAWFLFRSHRIWWGIVPSGVAILTNLRYAPPNVSVWFFIYLLAAMLLVIRMSFFLQERNWERLRIKYSPHLGSSFFPAAITLSAVILTVAWITPVGATSGFVSEVWNNVNSPWQSFQGDFNRLFASLTSEVEDTYSGFGRTMILKGPVSLSSKVAMMVRSDEAYYWRATSYDTYVGRGWVKRDQPEISSRPLGFLPTGLQYEARKEITQTVSMRAPKNDVIFAASQPVRVSIPAAAETAGFPVFTIDLRDKSQDARLPSDIQRYANPIRRSVERARFSGLLGSPPWPTGFITDLPPNVEVTRLLGRDDSTVTGVELTRRGQYPADVLLLRASDSLKRGQEYTVVSSVSVANQRQLRSAGAGYPSWVSERYLQVPFDLPKRIQALAETVAKEAANPYDKAIAIQNYLRTMRYNQNIEAPPPTVDPVEHFLFTSKEGYCDYYASAMVVMLRTLGIPARIATGYLTGSYDQTNQAFVVRESNAHAWPEVYFPRYGWVEFEPTASVDPITRSEDEETGRPIVPPASSGGQEEGDLAEELLWDEPGLDGSGAATAVESDRVPWAAGAGVILVLGVLAALVWVGWLQSLSKLAPTTQVYEKMIRLASFVGLKPKPSQTPYEYADYLGRALPDSARDIGRIAEAYIVARFGLKRLGTVESGSVERAWRRVRQRLLRRFVVRR